MIDLRRAAAIAGAAAVIAAVTACTSHPDKPQAVVGHSSTTVTASPPRAAPVYQILSKDDLTKALLPLNAMPTGYSDDPSQDSTGADKTFCNYKQPYTAKIRVSRSYLKGGGLSAEVIAVTLRQYADTAQAKASFDAMAKTLDTCREDTSDGQKVTYALMNVPVVGDRSLGVRIQTQTATVLQGFALVGPTLISTGTGGLITVNPDLVTDLLAKQAARYTDAATT
jgi:hypothetical protein